MANLSTPFDVHEFDMPSVEFALCPKPFEKMFLRFGMEGLVLSTAFISFAILAWLVIAKFGGSSSGGSGAGSGQDCTEQNVSTTTIEPTPVGILGDSGPGSGGDTLDGSSAAVDMPDDDVINEDIEAKINREMADKRSAIDDVGDDSSGVGTPSSSRRLSRRQRKNNRKREKEDKNCTRKGLEVTAPPRSKSATAWAGTVTTTTTAASPSSTPETATTFLSLASATNLGGSKTKKRNGAPCRQYEKLGLQDYQIYQCLMNYKLEDDRLRRLGFPMESELHPGKACVYQDPEFGSKSVAEVGDDDYRDDENNRSRSSSLLDVNAREFYPGSSSGRSPPQLSSTSPTINAMDTFQLKPREDGSQETDSKSEETSLHHSASSSSMLSAAAKEFFPSFLHKTESTQPAEKDIEGAEGKQCARCSKIFYVTSDGEYLTKEGCTYHWGKLRARRRKDRWQEDDRYTCCGAPASEASRGCCQCRLHVWRHLTEPGMHGPLDGFVRTKARKCYPPDGNYGIYSIDGEMCFTTNGLELIKLTVVGVEGRLVYESLVLPEGDIVDYNTRFSGISARDLKVGQAKTLREVQNDVMGFVNAHTILIGHGLENDLRALKVVHTTIIDTSIVFPHYFGLPYRRSLKSLVKSYLKRDIQSASWGHDSYEDARACIELMLWKVRKDMPLFGPKLKDFSQETPHQTVFFSAQQYSSIDQLGI